NDTAICKRIGSAETGECIYEIAVATNNVIMCDAINHTAAERSECFNYFANRNRNHTWCGEIDIESLRNSCVADFARLERNATLCDMMVGTAADEKDMCIYNAALAQGNLTTCLNITSNLIRGRCTSTLHARTGSP
ncbi:MAG: hypothetical protein V1835_02005, partial [Candidatus Micrarchaeota archaeon]